MLYQQSQCCTFLMISERYYSRNCGKAYRRIDYHTSQYTTLIERGIAVCMHESYKATGYNARCIRIISRVHPVSLVCSRRQQARQAYGSGLCQASTSIECCVAVHLYYYYSIIPYPTGLNCRYAVVRHVPCAVYCNL